MLAMTTPSKIRIDDLEKNFDSGKEGLNNGDDDESFVELLERIERDEDTKHLDELEGEDEAD